MTNTESEARPIETRPIRKSRTYSLLARMAIIAILSVPVLLYFGLGGYMTGEEFSPDDFSRRRFSYNQMPFFKINLWGIGYEDSTPVFAQTLLNDGLLGPGTAPARKNWDLIGDSWTNQLSPDLDASLLCKVLDIKDHTNNSVWTDFNDEHPKLAAKFWPIIANMARSGLYIEASELMLLGVGLQEADRESYLSEVKQTSTMAFNRLAEEKFADGDHASAVEIFDLSIEIQPTKDAYLGRSKCYQKLGKNQESKDDKLAAQKIAD